MESPNAPSTDGHSRACRRGYDVSGDVRSRRGRGVNRGYEDRPSPLMDGNKPIMGPRRRDRGANPRHLRSLRRVPPHPAASPRVPAPAHPGVGLVDAAHLGPRPAQGEDPCRARASNVPQSDVTEPASIVRVPVPDLCALWAETATAPMNIALIGVMDGIPLTGPDGAVALARIRSFVEARLPRAPMLLRTFRPTCLGQGTPAWIDAPGFDIRSRGTGH
jgi:hypothetical protein